MRKIEFRGKKEDNNEWIHGVLYFEENVIPSSLYIITPQPYFLDWI